LSYAPESVEEAAHLMADLANRRRTVGVSGGDAPSGPAAVAVDDVISTSKFARIVEYAPADQIVTVQAGMTIAQLQAELATKSQRLALDPPMPHRTTVGGAIAAHRYGALRTRYGTAKDVVIGMTIVRADGAIARGGGKVVKNVAGFDIPKLMIGTHGTLALIGTVTFRLHPLPQASHTLALADRDIASVRAITKSMTQAQLEPSAALALFDGASYTYGIRFEGFPAGVAAQCDTLRSIAGTAHDDPSIEDAHQAARSHGSVQIKITAPASQIEALHAYTVAPLYDALHHPRATIYPTAGAAFICGDAGDIDRVVAVLTQARAWAEATGGTLVTEETTPALRARFDPWGTPPRAFALMRALKDRFDPDRRLNPGGFVGGL
jgi:glycolate oxidase FAD binding subunit